MERKKEVGGRYATTEEIMLAFAKVKRARFARVTHRIQTFPLPYPSEFIRTISTRQMTVSIAFSRSSRRILEVDTKNTCIACNDPQ